MKQNKVALLIFSLIALLFIVGNAAAQDAMTNPVVVLSTNSLTFQVQPGNAPVDTTIRIVGQTDQVQLSLTSTELHDNKTGKTIPPTGLTIDPTGVTLSRGQYVDVNVKLTIADADAGTYQGAILLTPASSTIGNGNVRIDVTAQIKAQTPLIVQFDPWLIVLVITVAIGLIFGLKGENSAFGRIKRITPIVVVITGVFAVYIWVYRMINYSLGDINSVVITLIVTPFVGFVIGYVNEWRKDANEKAKTSRELNRKGIETDIDTLRSILGELATHCASFRPNIYDENIPAARKTIDSAKALYLKDGLLERKIWEPLRKQGMISDLPLLELEKYYDFIDVYNTHYSCAMTLTANIDEATFPALLKTEPFKSFEEFRKNYGELETVLFVNLTYYLGLFLNTNLRPIKSEYPRVTRTLLKRLVDYDILPAEDFLKIYQREVEKDSPGFYSAIETQFKNDLKEVLVSEPTDIEVKKAKAKYVIEKWRLTADELEGIVDKIYDNNNIPKFYRKVEDQFQEKYKLLKASAARLQPLPPRCMQDTLSVKTEKLKAQKQQLDNLELLKKLKDNAAIDDTEYQKQKAKLLEE